MNNQQILILFYPMCGHCYVMAKAAAEGVRSAGGESGVRQAQEQGKRLSEVAGKLMTS